MAVELLTTNLIEPKEIFARLDPKRITEELREPLARAVDQITHEIMTQYQTTAWEMLPQQALGEPPAPAHESCARGSVCGG